MTVPPSPDNKNLLLEGLQPINYTVRNVYKHIYIQNTHTFKTPFIHRGKVMGGREGEWLNH